MTRRSSTYFHRKTMSSIAVPQNTAKQFWILLTVSLLVAASVGAMNAWEIWFPTPAEKLVRVYRTPACRCASSWAKAIEAAGFTVSSSKMNSLTRVRELLRTPGYLHGCHLAQYLGYFVEGHVTSEALQKLQQERPQALGIVTQATLEATVNEKAYRDERGPVFLVDASGNPRLWFSPDE